MESADGEEKAKIVYLEAEKKTYCSCPEEDRPGCIQEYIQAESEKGHQAQGAKAPADDDQGAGIERLPERRRYDQGYRRNAQQNGAARRLRDGVTVASVSLPDCY